jgi:restriction system protein
MDNQNRGPHFLKYLQPVIDALNELGGSGQPVEIIELIAEKLNLTEEERTAQISSGQSRFSNQVVGQDFTWLKLAILILRQKGFGVLRKRAD